MTKFTGFVHDLRPWRLDHLGKPNSPWKKKKSGLFYLLTGLL